MWTVIAVGIAAGSCGGGSPDYINLQGEFVASSFDGLQQEVRFASFSCGGGDTAVAVLDDLRFVFRDHSADPEVWDNAEFQLAATWTSTCGANLPHPSERAQYGYRATVDSLEFRHPELGPWTTVPWLVEAQVFELLLEFDNRAFVVRFEKP